MSRTPHRRFFARRLGPHTLALLILPAGLGAADRWPVKSPGTNITAAEQLPGEQNLSGAVWNPARNRLFVVDDSSGRISAMDRDGGGLTTWSIKGADHDHEAITFADFNSPEVFVGVERSPRESVVRKVRKYLLQSDRTAALQQEWILPEMSVGPANEGLEGLTFVPNEFLAQFPDASGARYNGGRGSQFGAGGLFFASLQHNGTIYVYDLDIDGRKPRAVFVNKFTPVDGRNDLADLAFDRSSGRLFCLWDQANRLAAWALPTVAERSGHAVKEWKLWAGGKARSDEALAIAHPGANGEMTQLFVIDDRGESIWRFDQWPSLGTPTPAPVRPAR